MPRTSGKRESNRRKPRASTPRIPSGLSSMSPHEAALALAKCHIYVLPGKPGDPSPGALVGNDWQNQSSIDPDVINGWFNEWPDAIVFIHAGPSRLLIFDLDVDDLELVPEPYRSALRKAKKQSSRRGSDRGHYVFRLRPGERYSNSPGGFAGFGEVRGWNGVIRAAPSDHLKGGRYFWPFPGLIPLLPGVLRELLKEAAEHEPAMPNAKLQAFLGEHTREDRPGKLKGVLATFEREVREGSSRHGALVDALCFAFREAVVGFYPAQRAYDEVGAAFRAAFEAPTTAVGRRNRPGPGEAAGAAAWAASQALAADPAETLARADQADAEEREHIVRDRLENRFINDEVERRYIEQCYPFAALVAGRTFEDALELYERVAKEPRNFLIRRVLPAGSYGVIGAEFKAGKTWLAIDMLVSVVTGTPWLGLFPTRRGKVAVMVNEGDMWEFYRRLAAVCRSRALDMQEDVLATGRLRVQPAPSNLSDSQALNRIYKELAEFSPDLFLIDPWYLSAGEADGKNIVQAGLVLSNLQGIAQDIGAALMIFHHWNQTGSGQGFHRWTGAGLAEWGRVLINVSLAQFVDAQPYEEDPTGRTFARAVVTLKGQTSGAYQIERTIYTDDADDLESLMHYQMKARPVDAQVAAGKSPERKILRVVLESQAELGKTEICDEAAGSASGRARDELMRVFDKMVKARKLVQIGEKQELMKDGRKGRPVPVWDLSEEARIEALVDVE
jgi:hypothetical protein